MARREPAWSASLATPDRAKTAANTRRAMSNVTSISSAPWTIVGGHRHNNRENSVKRKSNFGERRQHELL